MKEETKKSHRLNSINVVILLATVLIGFSCSGGNKNKHHRTDKNNTAVAKADSGVIEGSVTDCTDSLIVVQAYGDTAVTTYSIERVKGKIVESTIYGKPLLNIDTIKIANGKFTYKYYSETPKNFGLAFIGKDGTLKGIAFQNPYLNRPYSCGGTCLNLDNNRITLTISGKDISHATIKGSAVMDRIFKRDYDEISKAEKAKEQANKGNEVPRKLAHKIITDFKVIKANAKNMGMLNKVYADRESYHSVDSLYSLYRTFDNSLQTSPIGKQLLAYIKSKVK